MIIQCRKRDANGDTTNSFDFFQKSWSEYKFGFGDIGTDYWIGLEDLYEMTSGDSTWKLKVGTVW